MPPKKKQGGSGLGKAKNHKVVLVGIQEDVDRYKLAKTLGAELGVPFEEAKGMLESIPVELFSSVPEEAAEVFADKMHGAGAHVEVLPLAMGPFCAKHPHKRARAKCKECGTYICEIEILGTGKKLLCEPCKGVVRRRRLVRGGIVAAVAALLLVLALLIRPTVERMLRFQSHTEGKRVLIACVADRLDPSRLKLFRDLGSQTSTYEGARFEDLAGVFNAAYREYTSTDKPWMTVEVRGILEIDSDLPVPAETGLGFMNYFRRMTMREGIGADAFDTILVVDLVAAKDVKTGAGFEPLVLASGGNAIYRMPTDVPAARGTYLAGAAYALGRVLGATGRLDESGEPVYPFGYAEPQRGRSAPQDAVEIMAGVRPNPGGDPVPAGSIDELVIGPKTAWELGWISTGRMKNAYRAATAP